MKRWIAIFLALLMLLPASAFAANEAAYDDVPDGVWYTEAAQALREMGLMNGMGGNRFEPDGLFTRAQLATVLYRMAGSPEVSGEDGFADTESGTWYSDAVLWASQSGVVNGYGDGRFGPDDATTQEQMAVMLWRSAGSYVLGPEYADENGAENDASDWAFDAVRWARVDGLLTEAVPSAPTEPVSRAMVADMVYRYLQLLERFRDVDAVSSATKTADGEGNESPAAAGSRTLVVYFSATGHTRPVAQYAAAYLGAELYEIVPETPYTQDDLNDVSDSRANREQRDPDARPAIAGALPDMKSYDTVLIGYPIWHDQAPKIIYTFLESFDASGKQLAAFCTFGSVGVEGSAASLKALTPGATWLESRRFPAGTAKEPVEEWLKQIGL